MSLHLFLHGFRTKHGFHIYKRCWGLGWGTKRKKKNISWLMKITRNSNCGVHCDTARPTTSPLLALPRPSYGSQNLKYLLFGPTQVCQPLTRICPLDNSTKEGSFPPSFLCNPTPTPSPPSPHLCFRIAQQARITHILGQIETTRP